MQARPREAVVNIYVASSWRNQYQPEVVRFLRDMDCEVYDFRNPPNGSDFGWEQINGDWKSWTTAQYREALKHPVAQAGYAADLGAVRDCDACLLVLPSGRSASWEFGYAMGQGEAGAGLQFEHQEPELMYSEAAILGSLSELATWVEAAVSAARVAGKETKP